MNKRAKFHKTSLYCPDDKDIYDFLKATGATLEKMSAFLRERGIYLSTFADSNEARLVVSRLVIGWNDVSALIDFVDLRENKERLVPKFLKTSANRDTLIQAFRDAEAIRQRREIEHYKIYPSSDGTSLTIHVEYLAVRNERNRLTQKENDSLSFVATKADNGFNVMHSNNATAIAIYEVLRGTLSELESPPDSPKIVIESVSISMKDIVDPELRVRFFRLLSENISGFEYQTMIDVKVDRLPRPLRTVVPDNEDENDDPDESNEDTERIRRVILSGTDLHRTKKLNEYFEEGFFISGMSWQSIHQLSDELIDFYAGFQNQQEAEGFEFSVLGRHIRVDGDFASERQQVPVPTSNSYCSLLQASAISALTIIKTEAKEKSE